MIDHREHRGHRAQNQRESALKLFAIAQFRISKTSFPPCSLWPLWSTYTL
jgi:hypothetical protein